MGTSQLLYTLDRDEAAIAVVNSNLHREKILPTEKAFACKMKMETMSHQGIASGQVDQKWSRDEVSEFDSGRQVQRCICLPDFLPLFKFDLQELESAGAMVVQV